MADIDEQRKRVEELKRKILEQKKKGDAELSPDLPLNAPTIQPPPVPSPVQEVKQPPVRGGSQNRSEDVPVKPEKNVPRQQEEPKQAPAPVSAASVQQSIPVVSLQAYAQTLKQAWSNGSLSKDEENLLRTLRKSMGISEEEHASLEQEVRLEIYLYAIIESWKNGALTPQDLERLDDLREKFNITAEEHMRLEKQVRQEILKQ
ncbi:MAG: hypothetical protein EHM64_04495 [Ignavibacteriae bacterium]|nr:MAG: hypothetical protein EHM64_04495 [Ignavibacteriota bacterium]